MRFYIYCECNFYLPGDIDQFSAINRLICREANTIKEITNLTSLRYLGIIRSTTKPQDFNLINLKNIKKLCIYSNPKSLFEHVIKIIPKSKTLKILWLNICDVDNNKIIIESNNFINAIKLATVQKLIKQNIKN